MRQHLAQSAAAPWPLWIFSWQTSGRNTGLPVKNQRWTWYRHSFPCRKQRAGKNLLEVPGVLPSDGWRHQQPEWRPSLGVFEAPWNGNAIKHRFVNRLINANMKVWYILICRLYLKSKNRTFRIDRENVSHQMQTMIFARIFHKLRPVYTSDARHTPIYTLTE